MLRPFLRCKIHRATVTGASLDYVGSMTIPQDLMRKLDILEGEQVEVANLSNGERWTTYALPGKKPGEFTLNGAAARLGAPGDKLIIMVYCLLDEREIKAHRTKVAFMGERNKLVKLKS